MIFELVVVGGSVAIPLFVQWLRLDRRVLRMKRVDVAVMEENARGKIGGTIEELERTIVAPLTGRPCVYYDVQIRNSVGMDPGDVIITETSGVPFVLADATGTAIVDPGGAVVKRLWDTVYGSPSDFDAKRVSKVLERHGYPHPSMVWRSRLHLTEVILAPGDVVEVVGAGIREPDPDGGADGYRTTKTRIRMVGSAKSPLWIVRDNRVVSGTG